ncbi:ABC transporter substrate-binding protein [Bradyrhizobium archetypum]|uniref:ABC transporter substrate-binding protein n=1 Tax=Bradyrhizobium archetypum TaxID=2721160 RepID=A0A7Y4HAH9_9BRAD|nr:ABC transporter substrate-binding protein [Bradyrhizobium archetypum]NOJ50680.1 ABC transporter substrate-binding protein [Bradyrhizobium archetypum]
MAILKSLALIFAPLFGIIGLPAIVSGQSVSNNEIRLGTIFSRDGRPEDRQIHMRVLTEYFREINNEGGINGRPIEIVSYDDEGDSKKTLDLTRQLVEQDRVACLFDLSARANEVIRPYARFKKIPVLFPSPTAFREAEILGSYISQHFPDATVAVLRPAGRSGTEYLNGFYEGLGMERARTAITNAQEIKSLDQSVNQVEPVSRGRAGLLVMFGPADQLLKLTSDLAKLEWNPLLIVNGAALSLDLQQFTSSAGIVSVSTPNHIAAVNSAFSHKNLRREDRNSTAAAYGYVLAKSIVSTLRSSSEMNRCELNVVRSKGHIWEVVDSRIPCEPSPRPQ